VTADAGESGAGGWRVPARLARREARRRPWRTLLMVALIGLPVSGAVGTAVTLRTTTRTVADEHAANWGRADDVVFASTAVEDRLGPAVRAAYPPGSRFVTVHTGPDAMEDDKGRLRHVGVSDRPLDEPLLDGTATMLEGRAPEGPGEVVLNEAALASADAEVGDEVELFLLGAVEVVGEFRGEATADPQAVAVDGPAPHRDTDVRVFVDVPAGQPATPDVAALTAVGASSEIVDGRGEPFRWVADEVRNKVSTTYAVVGVVLVVTAIVASAAFAVGARRQVRTLGVLSASGAPPAVLRRAVLLQGTVTGVVASLIGAALGLVGAAIAIPFVEDAMDRTLPALRVHPLDLVVPLALGIAAATAAAWMPARSAGRVPVLAALAGRRPSGRVPAALPLAGAAGVGSGAAALALWSRLDEPPWGIGVAAAVVVLLGGTALAPWIVSHTEALARRLRGGGRVAARGLARHRLRSGAVVAAIMAPAGVTIVAASAALTHDARERADRVADGRYELADDEVLVNDLGTPAEDADHVLAEVREVLPGADEFPVVVAVPRGAVGVLASAMSIEITDFTAHEAGSVTTSRFVVVGSADGLRRLSAPQATIDALEAGKAVVFGLVDPDATVTLTDGTATTRPLDRAHVATDPLTRVPYGGQIAMVSAETAQRWGAVPVESGTLFRARADLTEAQARAIRAVTDDDVDEWLRQYLTNPERQLGGIDVQVGREYGNSRGGAAPLTWAAAGGSLLFTLLVVAIALALDASESGDERALLAAIGAPPKVRRSIVAWQAFLLPALAAVVAVPAGLLVVFAVVSVERELDGPAANVGVQVPWGAMALLLVVVPLATAGLTWVGAAIRGRRRRDLSTLTLAAD
jgi:putative ABC transport system permease protein